jgi:23S rRNA A1618 N6-methylase RlmF
MMKHRVSLEQFDDLITQMSCPVIQHEIESLREGLIVDKKKSTMPKIKKYVTFSFVNPEDEKTWKKLKGIE